MSRNRKNQTAAVRFGPALRALSLCVFLGGSGVGYVWQKDQINLLGDQVRLCEKQYQQMRGRNVQLMRILASMQSPAAIEAQIRKIDLDMAAPEPDQIVRISESGPSADISGGEPERLYAVQREQP